VKIRSGFVSNSSSSSFIVIKKDLKEEQIESIRNHKKVAVKMGYKEAKDGFWDIDENDDRFILSTTMDNFDMETFLGEIEIPRENIEEGPEGFSFMQSLFSDIIKQMNTPLSDHLIKLSEALVQISRDDYSLYLSDRQKEQIVELKKLQQKEVSKSKFKKAARYRDEVERIHEEGKDCLLEQISENVISYKLALKKAIEFLKCEEIDREIKQLNEQLDGLSETHDLAKIKILQKKIAKLNKQKKAFKLKAKRKT